MLSGQQPPTTPSSGYQAGDVIGSKYRLLRILGEGGMGSVWVAENIDLAANVALKLIRADVAEPVANERFLSEARLAARLKHPAIVQVYDFGKTENEEPYIVMELLEGETLGQRLNRLGAMEPTELLRTLLPVIDALQCAHSHQVVHRDLKPDNIFIAKADDGGLLPKLMDFGIAKLRGQSAFTPSKLTQAGTLIGSPDYMSPEQARGQGDLDGRSDVWALCVVSYECLVGKPPFHGDNYNALLWAIIHDEPVPVTVYQAGDSELWRLLKRGFAKDRAERWDSAKRLGEAFAQWLESHGITEDICHRSLHASWLPTERPTRPELSAPFEPVAQLSSSAARSSDPAMMAPPAMAAGGLSAAEVPTGAMSFEGMPVKGMPVEGMASAAAYSSRGGFSSRGAGAMRSSLGGMAPSGGVMMGAGAPPSPAASSSSGVPASAAAMASASAMASSAALRSPAPISGPAFAAPLESPTPSLSPRSEPPTPSTAPPARSAASSHSALIAPTLEMIRRPHAISLWFAGIGVLTLLGAAVMATLGPSDDAVVERTIAPGLPAAASQPSQSPRALGGDPTGEAGGDLDESAGGGRRSAIVDARDVHRSHRGEKFGKPTRTVSRKTYRVRDLDEIPEKASAQEKASAGEKPKPKAKATPKTQPKSPPPRKRSTRGASPPRRPKAPPAKPKPVPNQFDFGI